MYHFAELRHNPVLPPSVSLYWPNYTIPVVIQQGTVFRVERRTALLDAAAELLVPHDLEQGGHRAPGLLIDVSLQITQVVFRARFLIKLDRGHTFQQLGPI